MPLYVTNCMRSTMNCPPCSKCAKILHRRIATFYSQDDSSLASLKHPQAMCNMGATNRKVPLTKSCPLGKRQEEIELTPLHLTAEITPLPRALLHQGLPACFISMLNSLNNLGLFSVC